MGCRSLSFAALAVWNALPQHIRSSDSLSAFQGLLKTFSCEKFLPSNFRLHNVASVSTYTLAMDSSRHIFHIASFLQNIWIAWRELPPFPGCLHLKTNERWTHYYYYLYLMVSRYNKSQRVGIDSKGMRPETLSTAPPPPFLKPNTFQSVQCKAPRVCKYQVFIQNFIQHRI